MPPVNVPGKMCPFHHVGTGGEVNHLLVGDQLIPHIHIRENTNIAPTNSKIGELTDLINCIAVLELNLFFPILKVTVGFSDGVVSHADIVPFLDVDMLSIAVEDIFKSIFRI